MAKPLKTVVIEDEAVIAETLRMMLEDLGYIVPDPAMNPVDGMETVVREQPDIILMDVNLNSDIDGIQLAAEVKKITDVPIVFITSYADSDTIERAKAISPAGYLVKPFTAQDIYAAIEIAMVQAKAPASALSDMEPQFIFIKSGTSYVKVNLLDIDFIRSEGVYLEVHCSDKKWIVRDTMDSMIERLGSRRFFRIHKSYCINIERIDLIETEIIKIGAAEIPMGRARKDELFKMLGIS